MGRRTMIIVALLLVMVVMIMTRSTDGRIVAGSASPSTANAPTDSASAGPSSDPPESSDPASVEPSEQADPADPGDETPYGKTDQARQRWAPVVEGFGRRLVGTEKVTADGWRKGLRPYVTTAVAKQLRTVDPGRIAPGRYAGYEALEWADNEVTVRVDYRQGWSIVLFVLYDGDTWQVRAYDRWEE